MCSKALHLSHLSPGSFPDDQDTNTLISVNTSNSILLGVEFVLVQPAKK